MPFNWSNESTITFLELLEIERVIWDVSNNNHKLKHKVHDAWKRISDALDIPVDELKSKKKSLMATFRPLLKKKTNSIRSGAGADEIFNPIWFAFDIMERFLGPTFTVDDTVNTEEELLQNNTTPPIQSNNEREESPKSNETEGTTTHKTATKTNTKKKRNMDHIISEADKKINDSFATLSHVLEGKNVEKEEDECDVYAKLLAKKLRKYPERMRDSIMYEIDGLLLANPYPEERQSSASISSFYSQQTFSTPSPQYAPTPSPQYVPTPSPQYAPSSSPQYVPTPSPRYAPTPTPQYATNSSASTYVLRSQNYPIGTSQATVYLHIPEENINMQNELILQSSKEKRKEVKSPIHILSQEVIVPTEISDIIENEYNDS